MIPLSLSFTKEVFMFEVVGLLRFGRVFHLVTEESCLIHQLSSVHMLQLEI